MDEDIGTVMDRLVAAGMANVKAVQTYTAERPVAGAAPDLLTVTVTAELVSTFDPAELTYTAIAVRARDGQRTAMAHGTSVEDVISALDCSVFD